MPVPIPGSKVGSDNQKVKFLTIFGRPKTRIFREFRGVPARAPLATNHAASNRTCAALSSMVAPPQAPSAQEAKDTNTITASVFSTHLQRPFGINELSSDGDICDPNQWRPTFYCRA